MLRTLVGKNVFIFFPGIGSVSWGIPQPTVGMTGELAKYLTHICIYMVFTNNNRKHFCSSQSVLPSVDNSMLIITQHVTDSKTDSTANTTAI